MTSKNVADDRAERIYFDVRPATETDSMAIRRIVRQAKISPFDLDWRRFLLADLGGRVIGTGQIRQHPDGSRELASIATIPEYQGKGVASAVIQELIAIDKQDLYLITQALLESFYERFGFHTIGPGNYPPKLARIFRLGNALARLASKVGLDQPGFVIMLREGERPSGEC